MSSEFDLHYVVVASFELCLSIPAFGDADLILRSQQCELLLALIG